MKTSSARLMMAVLAISISLFNSRAFADENSLRVNNVDVSDDLLAAFGQSMLPRIDYCPPISDEKVRDEYIDMVLLGQHMKQLHDAENQKQLDLLVSPHHELVEKLQSLLNVHPESGRIHRVYLGQLERTKNRISEINNEYSEKLAWELQRREKLSSRLTALDTVSLAEKQTLANLGEFQKRYFKRLRNEISEEEIARRYELLVSQNDNKLVEVYFGRMRSAMLPTNDQAVIDKVKNLFKNNASGREVGTAAGIHTATSLYDDDWWLQIHDEFSGDKKPAEISPGDISVVDVGLMRGDSTRMYNLTYYYEIKHYPIIELDQEPIHHFSARSYAKSKEWGIQLNNLYKKLWENAKVTQSGEKVTKATDYALCSSL